MSKQPLATFSNGYTDRLPDINAESLRCAMRRLQLEEAAAFWQAVGLIFAKVPVLEQSAELERLVATVGPVKFAQYTQWVKDSGRSGWLASSGGMVDEPRKHDPNVAGNSRHASVT